MKTKRIIYSLLFLIGIYLSIVSELALFEFRTRTTEQEMGIWLNAGSFLLLILSSISCFVCTLGVIMSITDLNRE